MITQEIRLTREISNPKVASPRLGAFPREPVGQFKKVFLAVNHLDIFEHVAAETTKEMELRVNSGKVKGQLARRYYSQPVTSGEILALLALQVVFRGRANLTNIHDQFSTPPVFPSKWPISEKRYNAINSCLSCNFPEFSRLLRSSWQEAIDPGTEFCVDETMYAFYSQNDAGSPQRFIPRKPHKNGLLSFMAGFKTREGPYIFDLDPDFEVNALNARSALQRMVARWPWKIPSHVIIDAGFSGELTHQILGDLGAKVTASLNTAHFGFLFGQLRLHCPRGSWLALQDQQGTIWSLFRNSKTEGEHFLATTAFQADVPATRTSLMGEDEVKALSKVGQRALVVIAKSLGVQIEGESYLLASNIATKINDLASPKKGSSPRTFSSISSPQMSTPETASDQVDTAFDKMSLEQLRARARDLGLKAAGKRKAELQEDLREARNTGQDRVAAMLRDLEEAPSDNEPAHHQKYREGFNAIDLHDGYWYDLQNHHYPTHWKPKFILSLLQSGLVNSWVAYRHFERIRLLQFYEGLAKDILC